MLTAGRTATGRREPNPWYHETFGPIRGRRPGWNGNCVLQKAMQGSMRPCLTAVLLGVGLLLAGNRGAIGAQPDPAQAFHIPDPLLGEYIRTALDSNPSIETAYAHYRAALQRVPQQTALPDPALTFGRFLRSVETREGPQLSTLTLSQRFPWFGKLDLKGKIAIKRAAARFRLFRAREREVAGGVKRAFYDVAYLDRALEIVREEQSLLDHYEDLAQARYASGKGRQQEVIRIQAEISRTMSRLELLRQQRQSAAARLNSLSDQPPEKSVPRLRLPTPAKVEIHLEELYELGARHRQELKGGHGPDRSHGAGRRAGEEEFLAGHHLERRNRQCGGPSAAGPASVAASRRRQECLQPLGEHQHSPPEAQIPCGGDGGGGKPDRRTQHVSRSAEPDSTLHPGPGGSHPDPVEAEGPV